MPMDANDGTQATGPRRNNPFETDASIRAEPPEPAPQPPEPTMELGWQRRSTVLLVATLGILVAGILLGMMSGVTIGPRRDFPTYQPKAGLPPSPRDTSQALADQAWRDLRQTSHMVGVYGEMFWKSASDDERLLVACKYGELDLVAKLLAAGARVNTVDHAAPGHPPVFWEGATPLMVAARGRKLEVVKLLLDKGADPEKRDEKDETVLIHAIRSGSEELAILLLDNGAEATARNPQSNESAYGLAFAKGMTRLCEQLERRGGHF